MPGWPPQRPEAAADVAPGLQRGWVGRAEEARGLVLRSVPACGWELGGVCGAPVAAVLGLGSFGSDS